MSLFNDSVETIPLDGGQLRYWPALLPLSEAEQLFVFLLDNVPWEQSRLRIAGRTIPIPRLNAWFGDSGANYGYSGVRLQTHPWPPQLLSLKQEVEQASGHRFNSALLNLYRDGNDSVDWHSDDEPELGTNPVIGSVSLGAERRFELRPRTTASAKNPVAGVRPGREKVSINLEPGSLLIMEADCQHHWQHRLPKAGGGRSAGIPPRINITFRQVGIAER